MRFEAPPPLDGDRLLDAIAAIETSGGANNWPRLEVSYMPLGYTLTVQGRLVTGTGVNFNAVVRPRWRKWGASTASSWSSWQILAHTAMDLGYAGDPRDLWHDEIALPFVVKRLIAIRDRQGAVTLSEFADAWNSGNCRDDRVPHEYVKAVLHAYG